MEPSFLNVGKNLEEALNLQKQHTELQEKLAVNSFPKEIQIQIQIIKLFFFVAGEAI